MTKGRLALALRILTVAALVAVAFSLTALVTRSPGDPPTGPDASTASWAGNPKQVHNACGLVGAYVAHGLSFALGTGSYLACLLAAALLAAYIIRNELTRRYALVTCAAAVALFVLLSLFSFDAASDPHRAYGLEATTPNACGWLGSTVAYYLMAYVGLGVWLALLAASVALAAYAVRFHIPDKILRVAGVLVLVCFASAGITVLHHHGIVKPDAARMLPEGAGGLLGLFLGEVFLKHLGGLGTYMFLGLMAAVGLLLSTDMLVVIPLAALWNWLKQRRATKKALPKMAGERLLRGLQAVRDSVGVIPPGPVVAAPAAGRLARTGEAGESPPEDGAEEAKAARRKKDSDKPAEKSVEEAGQEAEKPPERPAPKIRTPQPQKPREPEESAEPVEPQGRLIDASEGPGDQVPAYNFPSLDLLDPPEPFDITAEEDFIRENTRSLEATLHQFGVEAQVVGIDTGPVITQYEVSLGAGIKVGKVISLSDDLAIGLKAPSVRIVAPLPGRGTIGVEVPNRKRKVVRLRESIEDGLPLTGKFNLPLYLGKDSAGNPLVRDLTAMPHILLGGTTGSGKSVCLNSIIMSVLFTRSPRDVKFILVDPKMVEMSIFSKIPHLMCPVVSDMSKVYSILEWLTDKMEERYVLLAEAGVKNIVGYNALSREAIVDRFKPTSQDEELRLTYHMPYIILVVDELADLMMMAPKEVEMAITRLAQKSRAVGIHLILATQRPSVDVVTGLIKSNHPCRIAFQMACRVDSRTIIDCMGAEKLLGRGDMLWMQPGATRLIRAQCAFVSEAEIGRTADFVSQNTSSEYNRELVQLRPKSPTAPRGRGGAAPDDDISFQDRDELFDEAVRIVLQHQRGSVSLLQRKLNIGYGRASRLIDFMAEAGIVGDYKGSQAREAMMTVDEWEARRGEGVGALAGVVGDDEAPAEDDADAPPDDDSQ